MCKSLWHIPTPSRSSYTYVKKLAYRLLEALFVHLLANLDNEIEEAEANKATDHGELIDHLDLRGNVLEDLVVQIKTQLQFCKLCLLDDNASKYPQEVKEITRDVVNMSCRAIHLLLRYAVGYLRKNFSLFLTGVSF